MARYSLQESWKILYVQSSFFNRFFECLLNVIKAALTNESPLTNSKLYVKNQKLCESM